MKHVAFIKVGWATRLTTALLLSTLIGGLSCGDDGASTELLCPAIDCGENGECVEGTDAGAACVCDEGFTGEFCDSCAEGYTSDGDGCLPATSGPSCEEDSCGAHGSCSDSTGEIVCDCAPGYAGDTCDECAAGYHEEGEGCEVDINCRDNTCNSAGSCSDASGTPVCSCDDGYTGERCTECDTGYHASGDSCIADETCDACPENSSCELVDGEAECTCDEGYTGLDCDECEVGLVLNDAGECEPEPECEDGFELNEDGECEEVPEECDEGLIPVEQEDGSITCEAPVASCAEEDPCSVHGTCEDDTGELLCVCDEGYAGDICDDCDTGYIALDDLCVPSGDCPELLCSSNGTCEQTGAVYGCVCNEGYMGVDCSQCAVGYYATDDGCQLGESCTPELCSGRGACGVQDGVATCTCYTGFAGEFCLECAAGYHAEDDGCKLDSECLENSCGGRGTCSEVDNEISCSCDEGYAGTNCQACAVDYTRRGGECLPYEAPDTCTEETCQDHGTCDDSSGIAVCTCDELFVGTFCQSCVAGYVLHPDDVCRVSVCGDGITDGLMEENCDDGNDATEQCPYSLSETPCSVCAAGCTVGSGVPNFCGDGNTDGENSEVCDDGALNGLYDPPPGDGLCAADCSGPGPFCGDGIVQGEDGGPGEQCEPELDEECSDECLLEEAFACVDYTWTGSQALLDQSSVSVPFTVTEAFEVIDVDVYLRFNHTFYGDLRVTVSHSDVNVIAADPSCGADHWLGVWLDDEGTAPIPCQNNLVSPPNYLPQNALSAFDGLDSQGAWTVTVADMVNRDTGTLFEVVLRLCQPAAVGGDAGVDAGLDAGPTDAGGLDAGGLDAGDEAGVDASEPPIEN